MNGCQKAGQSLYPFHVLKTNLYTRHKMSSLWPVHTTSVFSRSIIVIG